MPPSEVLRLPPKTPRIETEIYVKGGGFDGRYRVCLVGQLLFCVRHEQECGCIELRKAVVCPVMYGQGHAMIVRVLVPTKPSEMKVFDLHFTSRDEYDSWYAILTGVIARLQDVGFRGEGYLERSHVPKTGMFGGKPKWKRYWFKCQHMRLVMFPYEEAMLEPPIDAITVTQCQILSWNKDPDRCLIVGQVGVQNPTQWLLRAESASEMRLWRTALASMRVGGSVPLIVKKSSQYMLQRRQTNPRSPFVSRSPLRRDYDEDERSQSSDESDDRSRSSRHSSTTPSHASESDTHHSDAAPRHPTRHSRGTSRSQSRDGSPRSRSRSRSRSGPRSQSGASDSESSVRSRKSVVSVGSQTEGARRLSRDEEDGSGSYRSGQTTTPNSRKGVEAYRARSDKDASTRNNNNNNNSYGGGLLLTSRRYAPPMNGNDSSRTHHNSTLNTSRRKSNPGGGGGGGYYSSGSTPASDLDNRLHTSRRSSSAAAGGRSRRTSAPARSPPQNWAVGPSRPSLLRELIAHVEDVTREY